MIDPKVEDKGNSYSMLAYMDSYLNQHVKGSLTKLSYREHVMRAKSWSQFLNWVTHQSKSNTTHVSDKNQRASWHISATEVPSCNQRTMQNEDGGKEIVQYQTDNYP